MLVVQMREERAEVPAVVLPVERAARGTQHTLDCCLAIGSLQHNVVLHQRRRSSSGEKGGPDVLGHLPHLCAQKRLMEALRELVAGQRDLDRSSWRKLLLLVGFRRRRKRSHRRSRGRESDREPILASSVGGLDKLSAASAAGS